MQGGRGGIRSARMAEATSMIDAVQVQKGIACNMRERQPTGYCLTGLKWTEQEATEGLSM